MRHRHGPLGISKDWKRTIAPLLKRAKDGIQYLVQALADIFCQETQDQIAVFLKQRILSPIPSVGIWV